MKTLKTLLVAVGAALLCSAFTTGDDKPARSKDKTVYAFGVAASFNDSSVYFTDIQPLDSVALEKKTGFLPHRALYAYQLKNYLEYNLQKKDYTPMIYFGRNKAKLQKEATKVKGKYKAAEVKQLTVDDFKFEKPQE